MVLPFNQVCPILKNKYDFQSQKYIEKLLPQKPFIPLPSNVIIFYSDGDLPVKFFSNIYMKKSLLRSYNETLENLKNI